MSLNRVAPRAHRHCNHKNNKMNRLLQLTWCLRFGPTIGILRNDLGTTSNNGKTLKMMLRGDSMTPMIAKILQGHRMGYLGNGSQYTMRIRKGNILQLAPRTKVPIMEGDLIVMVAPLSSPDSFPVFFDTILQLAAPDDISQLVETVLESGEYAMIAAYMQSDFVKLEAPAECLKRPSPITLTAPPEKRARIDLEPALPNVTDHSVSDELNLRGETRPLSSSSGYSN